MQTEASSMPAQPSRRSIRLHIWAVAALIVAVLLQLIAPLFAQSSGTDGPSQKYLMDQFSWMLTHGGAFPRWVPTGFGGRGSPVFYFYPPLAFYISSAVRSLFGLSSLNSIFQLTCWIASVASFGTAYLLIRQLGSSRYWSAIGAALFAFAPFQIAELYSRSSLSSHIAFVFVPLVCLGVVWIFCARRAPGVLLLAVATACLVLTSVTVAAAIGFMLLVVLAVLFRELTWKRVLDLLLAGIAAFGISAVYVLPAAALSDQIQPAHFLREPDFFLIDLLHLNSLVELYHTALILLSAAIGVIAWLQIRRRQSTQVERTTAKVAMILAGVVVVLQIPVLSLPIWHNLPPLKLLQGSWRLYIAIVLSSAVVIAVIRSERFQRLANGFVLLLALSTFVPSLVVILNVHIFEHTEPEAGDPLEYLPLHARFEKAPLEPIRVDSILSATPALGEDRIALIATGGKSRRYSVSFAHDHRVTLPLYYWPRLEFKALGRSIPTSYDESGYLRLALPAGTYDLQMRLVPAPVERIGFVLTVFFVFGLSLFAIILLWRRARRSAVQIPAEMGGSTAEMVLPIKS